MGKAFPRISVPAPASAPSSPSSAGSPPSPRTQADEQDVADRIRADLQAIKTRRQNIDLALSGVGELANMTREYLQGIRQAEAFAARDEGQTDLVIAMTRWEERFATSDMPEETFGEYWSQFEEMRTSIADGIRHNEEQGKFLQFANQMKRQRYARVMGLAADRTRAIGKETFYRVGSKFVEAGDLEALRGHIDDYVEQGLLDPSAGQPGGALMPMIRETAVNQVTQEAFGIYDAAGLDAAKLWLFEETNHPTELTGADLRSIGMNLDRHAEAIESQAAKVRSDQAGTLGNQVWEWTANAAVVNVQDIDDAVDNSLLDYSLEQRSDVKLQLYQHFGIDARRKAAADVAAADAKRAREAAEAFEKNTVSVGLEALSHNLSLFQTPHFEEVVQGHRAVGTISDGQATRLLGRTATVRNEEKETAHQFVDDFLGHVRLANRAAELGLTTENIQGDRLYDDKGDEVRLGALDGAVLETIGPDGQIHVIPLFQIGNEIKDEFDRQFAEAQGGDQIIDSSALVWSLLDQKLKQLVPGRQLGEAVDLQGNLIYQGPNVFMPGTDQDPLLVPEDQLTGTHGFQFFQEWQRRRGLTFAEAFDKARPEQRAWFSDAYAVQAGIDYLGRGGAFVPGAEVATRSDPIGDSWTGRSAIVAMGLVSDNDLSGEQANVIAGWQQAMGAGQYTLAAAFAATLLPTEGAELDRLVDSGALASWREAPGGFMVKFDPVGLWYPVYSDDAPPMRTVGAGTTAPVGGRLRPEPAALPAPAEEEPDEEDVPLDVARTPGTRPPAADPLAPEPRTTFTVIDAEPGPEALSAPGAVESGPPEAGIPPAPQAAPAAADPTEEALSALGEDATRRNTDALTDEERIGDARVRAAIQISDQFYGQEPISESAAVNIAQALIDLAPRNLIVTRRARQLLEDYRAGEDLDRLEMAYLSAQYLNRVQPDWWRRERAARDQGGAEAPHANPLLFERAFNPRPTPGEPSQERVDQARVNAAVRIGIDYAQGAPLSESDAVQIAQALIAIGPRNLVLIRKSQELIDAHDEGYQLDRLRVAEIAAEYLNHTAPDLRWWEGMDTERIDDTGSPPHPGLMRAGDRRLFDHPMVNRLTVRERARVLGLKAIRSDSPLYLYFADSQHQLPAKLAPYVERMTVMGDMRLIYLFDIPPHIRSRY